MTRILLVEDEPAIAEPLAYLLGPILLSEHNLTYYQRLMAGIRTAIAAEDFELAAELRDRLRSLEGVE